MKVRNYQELIAWQRAMDLGSLREVETQKLIAGRLNYLTDSQVEAVIDRAGEVGRLFNGLMNSLSR